MSPPLQHIRHNTILIRLKNGETLSITKLANEWKTSTKTVYRDFTKLMEGDYGIQKASDGKQFTMVQPSLVSEDVHTAIKVLDSLSSDIGGKFYTQAQTALHKLQIYKESSFYTRIDVENISQHLEILEKLEDAIAQQKVISFHYKKGHIQGKHKSYSHVKPYKIIIFNGFWYLLAQYKEHYIKFYLKEIRQIEVQEETFSPDTKVLDRLEKALNIWFDPKAEPFDVILLLEHHAIVYFERKPIKGQYLKKNSDNTAELTLRISDKRELFTLLKEWLPQIRVIEPYALQEEFEVMVKNYLEK